MNLLANSCTNCGGGQYTDQLGQTGCKGWVVGNMLAVLVTQVAHLVVVDNIKIVDSEAVAIIVHLANIAVVVEIADVVYGKGQYQNSEGQTGCKDCGTGKFQDETTKDSCKDCGKGKYQANLGKSNCEDCGKRIFSSKYRADWV